MSDRDWANTLIQRGREAGPLFEYGSREWRALPPSDPRRIASCVLAAEAWRAFWEPEAVRRRLEDEITAARQVESRLEAESWQQATSNVVKISTSRNRGSWETPRQGAK